MAVPFSVRLEPEFPSLQLGFFQRLRDIVTRAKVHLVRRLPLERRVWQMAVVLIDVERDQLPYAGCGMPVSVLEHSNVASDCWQRRVLAR